MTRNQGEIIREVQDVQQQGEFHFEQIRDIFLKLADDQADMRKMIQTLLSRTGTQEMTVLLQHGQMVYQIRFFFMRSTHTFSGTQANGIRNTIDSHQIHSSTLSH
jgi:hypothetical protein